MARRAWQGAAHDQIGEAFGDIDSPQGDGGGDAFHLFIDPSTTFVLRAVRHFSRDHGSPQTSLGEVAEAMRAQIEGVDVAGGEFGITGWAGFAGLGEIVDGGGIGVAVGGVEVEVVKTGVGGKGVGHGAGHGGAEGGIGFCAEGEASFALEQEEKPADGRQAQLGLH